MHEARKTVTVLFADVVASTELGERLDPEALRQVVTRYFTEMAVVIERHGGTVEKFIGDEVMAVFGVPAVHEDDALRAVRAAAAMHERLARLNDDLEASWGARLEIRIGINTGEVVAGDASAGHGFVTGDAVTLAKRIEQATKPGEILLGEATWRLVRHAVATNHVGPLLVKGRRAETAAYRLEAVDPASEALPRRFDAPLVARAKEVAALRAAFAQAVETRRPQLVTVLGPAGIGKSRLARELLEEVGSENALVGRCLPYGEGITFWPVGEILPDESLEGTSEEIFLRIRKRLEALARERPLAVCLEDVHWAEPTFLDLIEYLVGWMVDAPILLLCLARPELFEKRPDWPTGGPSETMLTLGPLSSEEAGELLDYLDTPGEMRDRIARAAEGNPLFVEQMAAMASEGGVALVVPPSIQAVLMARLDRLDPDESAVMDHAAVIGRDFPLRAVLELVPDGLRHRASTLLLALVRKGLVRPKSIEDEDGFSFRHGLIRDAAYEGMPKGLRAELHDRHAAWLEENGSAPVLIGYHLEQAATLLADLGRRDARTEEIALRAGRLLGDAGQRAFARGDMPAAAALLTRATGLLANDDRARLELASDLGAALADLGESTKADALLERTIADAEGLGDRTLQVRAQIARSTIQMQLTPKGAAEDVARVAETAIEVFSQTGDEVGLAQAWSHLSRVHLISSRWGAATEALERALVHARRAGTRREEAKILGQLALSMYWGPTAVPHAIERCEQMLAETDHDPTVEARVMVSIAGLEAMRGAFDRARALYWESKQILADLGLTPWLAAHTLALSSLETLAGDPGAAEDELRFGVETLERLGLRSSFSTLASALARTCFETGRWEEAEQLVERARLAAASDDVASEVLWRTTAAKLLAAKGDVEAAERLAREALSRAEETDALNLHADSLVDLARVLSSRGHEEGADLALAEAARLYRLKGNEVSERRALDILSSAALDP